MIKNLALTAVAALYIFNCYGQDDAVPGKAVNYYVGVQANQLFNAIINLNANSVPVSNPYLIIASANSVKYGGWGVQGGFGYNYQDITNKLTPSSGESKISDISYRAGIGRKVMVSKKFQIGYGLDYIGDYHLDQTFTSSVTNFGNGSQDSTASTTTDKPPAMAWAQNVHWAFTLPLKL